MGEWIFFSFILGIGLAADAFSVSVADAFSHPEMGRPKRLLTAGVFGGFQMAMPLIGWLLVRTAEDVFSALERAVPWIAMIILTVLGTRMIAESLRGDADPEADGGSLLWQGLATSIDALSAGLTMSSFDAGRAFATSLIIGAVTFGLCLAGLFLGRRLGKHQKLQRYAGIIGGAVLILIGIRIAWNGVL
ncbi:MAG: manganese efflux pump [Lachnospiraceae bacterium]|nr:manganese efflux pump [Lachnospiraceae bacterium]